MCFFSPTARFPSFGTVLINIASYSDTMPIANSASAVHAPNHGDARSSDDSLELDRLTTLYISLFLFICLVVGLFLLSKPITEAALIRWIFGEQMNYCNYTYVPADNAYRRPNKIYI